MTRRLTSSEAIDLIETVFEVGIDNYATGLIEAFVGDFDVGAAKADIESYLAMVNDNIDPDTISVMPDRSDETGTDCVHVIIRTEG